MNLDRVTVDLRPRESWEAIDLGFRLARVYYGRMWLASLAITLPLFVVTQALFWGAPVIAMLVLWWSKPIWERIHLHIVSRALFGEEVSVARALRDFRQYAFLEWLAWLTVRRLSPTRSMDLPITQLEKLSGKLRNDRARVLRRGPFATAATWLTLVCAHVEGLLPIAVLLLLRFLLPQTVEWSPFGSIFEAEETNRFVSGLTALSVHLAALLVAPFYVAAGFSLYVHRRTLLEGWDLEIAFRSLATRLTAQSVRAAGVALAVLCTAHAFAGEARAEAADVDQSAVYSAEEEIEQARADIRAVLEGDAFHDRREVSMPRFISECRLQSRQNDDPTRPEWVVAMIEFLAAGLEVLVVAFLTLLVAVLVRRGIILRGDVLPGRRSWRRPTRVLGLDVTPESLPDDVVAAARSLWRTAGPREALALLYRATLSHVVEYDGVELRESDTEAECLSAARDRIGEAQWRFLGDLTRAWLLVAYGHRAPSEERFDVLCTQWPALFPRAEAAGVTGPAQEPLDA